MAIFGKILYLPYASGTIVFVSVLVVFTLFEGVLHVVEVECRKRGLKGLVKKMYREFMIMGCISFAIMLATELSNFTHDIWYDAFHFAHIILLFIGFVFLIQSGILTSLVSTRRKTLLSHENSTSEQLIVDYVKLHTRGGIRKTLFEHGPISIPVPALREKIEYKLIQEFFVRNYNLPPEFRFTNYMCGVLRDYVLSLVEVRPISWIVMACFVTLNLVRVRVIDHIIAYKVCERYPSRDMHRGPHRMLSSMSNVLDWVSGEASSMGGTAGGDAGGGGAGSHAGEGDDGYAHHVCEEYLLRYVLICVFFIFLYLVGVLVASEVYIQRLVDKVLDQEETIEWLEDEEQRQYFAALEADIAELPAFGEDPNTPATQSATPPTVPNGNGHDSAGAAALAAASAATAAMDVSAGIAAAGDYSGPGAYVAKGPDETKRNSASEPGVEMVQTNGGADVTSVRADDTPVGAGNSAADGSAAATAPPRQPTGDHRLKEHRELSLLPPVHGGAAIRRLTAHHRAGSASAAEVSAMIAAGTAKDSAGPGTGGIPVRRGMNAAYRTSSLRNESDLAKQRASPSTTGPAPRPLNESSTVTAESIRSLAAAHNIRRLVAAHRAGSLRSEHGSTAGSVAGSAGSATGSAEADLHSQNAQGGAAATNGGGLRRLQSSQRAGSVRSTQSETSEKLGPDASKFRLVNSSSNRRFLYLRCLERIMHQEFDFHANEARRVALEPGNAAHNGDNSSYDMSQNDSHTGNTPSPQPPMSPRGRHNHSHSQLIRRTHSAGSLHEMTGEESPLVHGDMRSNFLLMKSLRQEMLQQESQHGHGQQDNDQRPKSLFGGAGRALRRSFSSVGSADHAETPGDYRELRTTPPPGTQPSSQSQLPPPPPAQPRGMTANRDERGSQVSLVSSITDPSRAVHDAYSSTDDRDVDRDQSQRQRHRSSHEDEDDHHVHDHRSSSPNSDSEAGSDHGGGSGEGGGRRRLRHRTFSLAFESPPLAGHNTPSPHSPEVGGLRRTLSVASMVTATVAERAWSALLAHHIGHAEPKLDADIADLQRDFAQIFLFSNAELYYFVVEFALLVQCVYLALWATNFIFVANDSYNPALWHLALVAPIPLNFLITKQIIFTSVMLKSIVTLDKHVADKICEDAVDERNVKQRVRRVIRAALRAMEIPKENWEQYTHNQFELFIPDSDNGLNLANLKLFLHSLQIFLTDGTVERIFKVLDVTLEDCVQWDNLFPVVFPELVRKQVKLKRKQARGNDMSIDLQIEGNLKSSRARKAETKQKRKARRQSTANGISLLAPIGEDSTLGGGNGDDCSSTNDSGSGVPVRRARFADGSGAVSDLNSSNGRLTPLLAHPSDRRNGLHGTAPSATRQGRVSSDDSDRHGLSSDSSFNSHSLSDGDSTEGESEREHQQQRLSQSAQYLRHSNNSFRTLGQAPPHSSAAGRPEYADLHSNLHATNSATMFDV